ncbi:Afadin and alpha-actinin-binding-domain-containing protein [Epithele typhae]|uniref:Afadin and alpha-actinin-binding-domain-containing protein n=1 Tax=Epithele typhae TaxID=378194 RepID=UPI0020086911|nr:Afadin and alpha-actinin-binding-domain-containing protein [Epithele typhae]KAH9939056.1 Afadin and alpha-actinin-binding-domain-containing protein [Epithele typhae]
MPAATPKKLVHWAFDASFPELGSPFSEAPSTDSYCSTSSLQYVNSQLLSHGFLHDAGLSLDGLGKDDTDRVVKCILGMLSQRVDDMSRTEDLTTKLRTLSYDHERLTSMYKSENEKAGNAEREMNLHKTRMTAATKSLQSSENAHKHTTAELQRTRTSLQSLRGTHQTEIKKLEKEKERMIERWGKLSDSQLKASSLRSGLSCANLEAAEASDVQMHGQGTGFLDVALEQAEAARKELLEQNRRLRDLLLSAANGLQNVLHEVCSARQVGAVEEPSLILSSSLFPESPVESASETFSSLFKSLRGSLSQKTEPPLCNCPRKQKTSVQNPSRASESAELERLQGVIDKLREELDNSQKQAAASAAQTQELFDRFAEEQRLAASNVAEMSVDLMTSTVCDEEKARLEERFKQLEEERRKFTEAAIRLGKEKAAIEAERLKLLEEKRAWEVEMMLAELPPTPIPTAGSSSQLAEVPPSVTLRTRSPRKSPRKLKSIAAGARKSRASRRSSGLGAFAPTPKAKVKAKVSSSYETEVLPSAVPVSSAPPSPRRPPPEFKTSMTIPAAPSPAHLTSAFVLPPPSPAAALPSIFAEPSVFPPLPPIPKLQIPPFTSVDGSMEADSDPSPSAGAASSSSWSSSSSSTAPSTSSSVASSSAPPVPHTPVARPFPMAKPFAQRMTHAYSPVKPSPLSRILMLGASPDSPEGDRLGALAETSESSFEMDVALPPPVRSLAEELGVSESSDDYPLRETQPAPPATKKVAPAPPAPANKGKGKAAPAPAPPAKPNPRTRAGAALEKENVKRVKLSAPAPAVAAGSGSTGSTKSSGSAASSREKRGTAAPKPPAGGAGARTRAAAQGRTAAPKGGARRVPAGSAQAANVPSWKG